MSYDKVLRAKPCFDLNLAYVRPLVSPAGSVTLGEKQHTVLFFKTLTPLRYPLEKAWVSALLHKLVGVGAYDDPRSWESNFTFGKSQRLLRRSPCEARVLHRLASIDCYDAFKSAGLPQQNFAALRMTHSRGVRAVGVC